MLSKRFVRKPSKRLYTSKTTKTTFSKKRNCFFICHGMRCQTHEVKNQSTKNSLWWPAQPKRYSAFEQKTRIVSCREISGSSQDIFFDTTIEKSRAELKKTFMERIWRRFGKFVFCFRWNSPSLLEGLYENHENDCTHYKTTKNMFPTNQRLFL